MKRIFPLAFITAALTITVSANAGLPADKNAETIAVTTAMDNHRALYETLSLQGTVDYAAFEQAITGFEQIKDKTKNILVLVDYSKPSTQERFFVIDLENKKILYRSLVAHGRGSGDNYATSFSNVPGSHKSSLGFYLTANTYQGRNGYSLRLKGLEQGINDKAMERAIVIHGADYCDRSFISSAGRLGRSFGCPSLPKEINDEVIDVIKEGAVLFIYAADKQYCNTSPILSRSSSLAMK